MQRTIDQFYNQAHAPQNGRNAIQVMGSRLPYFMVFVALGLANVGDAAEIGSMGFLLANDGFRDEILGELGGVVASCLYIGMLIGGIGSGPLCDQTGRRNVLLYGLLLNSSFGVAASVSNAAWQISVCRFMMGLGIGSIVSCLLALTSEHTPPRLRGFYLNFVSAFWTVGSIYVAALALVLFGELKQSWRVYVLINAIPSIISFLLVTCFVPESARFLALHGHHDRATTVANRIAGAMGFRGEKLKVEEIRAQFPPGKQISNGNGYWVSLGRICSSFKSLYRRETRGRTIGVQLLWFFVSFGSGMCLWIARVFSELDYVKHVYSMAFFFSLASVPGVIIAGLIMDKIGRTFLLSAALVATTLALAAFAFLVLFTNVAWAVLLSACIFHSFLVIGWSALSVVTAEVFPTSIRSTAMGLCAASGRFASILVHLVSAPLISMENPAILLFMGSGSFALAIVTSIITQLQNKTGAALDDVDATQKQSHGRSRERAANV